MSAARLLASGMSEPAIAERLTSRPLHVLAVGKAAAAMAAAFVARSDVSVRRVVAIGTHRHQDAPPGVEWFEASHPLPDQRSEQAAERALAMARGVAADEALVLLLSGGASALMAAPIEGVSLDDKIQATKVMMEAGADIHALNTVRRHLSRVKGGRLAAACPGWTVTLAISDVVGDALHAIGSGPGVPDPSTWADVWAALNRWGGPERFPVSVVAATRRGVAGRLDETPKSGEVSCARATAWVIGSGRDAVNGAAAAAAERGYHPLVVSEPVVGEARAVAPGWLAKARQLAAGDRRPVCVVSSGETTVRVVGRGRGGRNLEFSLALADPLSAAPVLAAAASVGTDGIDGSSGVAGAVVDGTTLARASSLGLDRPARYLDDNDSLAYFEPLGDLIRLGRTDTNVGDLQVLVLRDTAVAEHR